MKTRLDILLVNRGFAKSREKAKTLIKSGSVSVNGAVIAKVSETFDDDAKIAVSSDDEYVSRGAYKLKHAIDIFKIDLSGKTCLDIGASTGGFTQVMLDSGAKKVYAVDVGHGQLDESLLADERVVSMEGVNFRYMDAGEIAERADFAAADLSFISLKLILGKAYEILADDSEMVCLIKPQFEAGRENVGKHGLVRERAVHMDVINGIIEFCAGLGFNVAGLTHSPIKGGDGNIEYLVYITKKPAADDAEGKDVDVKAVVQAAFDRL